MAKTGKYKADVSVSINHSESPIGVSVCDKETGEIRLLDINDSPNKEYTVFNPSARFAKVFQSVNKSIMEIYNNETIGIIFRLALMIEFKTNKLPFTKNTSESEISRIFGIARRRGCVVRDIFIEMNIISEIKDELYLNPAIAAKSKVINIEVAKHFRENKLNIIDLTKELKDYNGKKV